MFAALQKKFNLPYEKYESASQKLTQGIFTLMLCDNKYFKGNATDQLKTAHEYYDGGVFEIFANGLITNKKLFLSNMDEYDKVMRIKGQRPGYIRLISADQWHDQRFLAQQFLNFAERRQDNLLGKIFLVFLGFLYLKSTLLMILSQ